MERKIIFDIEVKSTELAKSDENVKILLSKENAIEICKSVSNALDFCDDLKIKNIKTEKECDEMNKLREDIKIQIDNLELLRKKFTVPINAKLSSINEVCKIGSSELSKFQGQVIQKLSIYAEEQRKIAEEKQRESEEKARKEQEELNRKAEELRKKAEAEAKKGNTEKAESLLNKAEEKEMAVTNIITEPITLPKKINGFSQKEKFTGEVINKEEFIKYCLKMKNLNYLDINQTYLDKMIDINKGQLQIPGVKIVKGFRTLNRIGR